LVLAGHAARSTAATKAELKLFTVQLFVSETQGSQTRQLAAPVLMTRDGEASSFLAGGELPDPVKVSQAKADIEYIPYGIQAHFTVREIAVDQLHVSLGVSEGVLSYDKNGEATVRQIGARCFRTVRPGDAIVLDMGQGLSAKVIVTPTAAAK
jgi:Flp pilus assembly secretin CpaC